METLLYKLGYNEKLTFLNKGRCGIWLIWVGALLATAIHFIPFSLVHGKLLLILSIPLAFFISKIIKVDFQNKENPLTNLGILFSANQILYLLIAMWVYPTVPQKMLMVIAMIFGGHLLPYGWLYKSKSYIVFAILVPILSLIVGISFKPYILAVMMILIEILFSICLILENKKIS